MIYDLQAHHRITYNTNSTTLPTATLVSYQTGIYGELNSSVVSGEWADVLHSSRYLTTKWPLLDCY
jgi:hypothetical protein